MSAFHRCVYSNLTVEKKNEENNTEEAPPHTHNNLNPETMRAGVGSPDLQPLYKLLDDSFAVFSSCFCFFGIWENKNTLFWNEFLIVRWVCSCWK